MRWSPYAASVWYVSDVADPQEPTRRASEPAACEVEGEGEALPGATERWRAGLRCKLAILRGE